MLNDFPMVEDFSFPISPENSLLGTLGSFRKPSPSLTPSKPEFTWSSSNIPLILYDNAYIDERGSGLIMSGNNQRESVVTLASDVNPRFSLRSLRVSSGSRTNLVDHGESVVIGSSASSDTIRSAATFGTRNQPTLFSDETWHSISHRLSQSSEACSSSESTIVEEYGTETTFDDNRFLQSTSLHRRSNISDSPRADQGYYNYRSGIDEASASPIQHAATPSEIAYPELPSSASLASVTVEEHGDGFGNMKGSPSAQTWVSDWDYNNDTAGDPTPESFERNLAFIEKDLTRSEFMPPALETIQEAFSSPEGPPDSAIQGFLRATTVQFLIDQEGFRDAEPSFRFCGTSRLRSSRENKTQDAIMAQFRPTLRQQFHFHHAPLESPPVLRRITVNNDEASDYVSRQAHLTLKSNGVYVIRGHEISSTVHASEQSKLHWQFEYLVDDRRIEFSGSRQDLEGEKTFTPLTFSCSPRLLLPAQAKRINIMHVFKKSLAPKLVPEKLQVRLGAHPTVSNPSPERLLPRKALHYRTSPSYGPSSRGAANDTPNKRTENGDVLTESRSDGQQPTSAALDSQPSSRYGLPLPSHEDGQHSNTSSTDMYRSPAAGRYIVPPARLSELLIQDSDKESRVSSNSVGRRSSRFDTYERDSKTFVALSPRMKRP